SNSTGSELQMSNIVFTTPDLSDAHPAATALPYQFLRFGGLECFAGPAATIRCFEDNSRVAEAVAEPGAGRVLVVDGRGSLGRSLLGDNLAAKAMGNQWAGVIVLGAIRDVEIIDAMAIGVLALGVVPIKTEKQGAGERDVKLSLNGVELAPGDWIYADRNGVLVSTEAVHT
ncbi:MAG: ribonuclease E activity regulator RraA, partial [Luminiphilus sp.]